MIETDFIDVPLDFKIACEAFGIMVPDFLQLILNDFSYHYLYGQDDGVRCTATKVFSYVEHEVLHDDPTLKSMGILEGYSDELLPLYKKLVKLSQNRNYSRVIKQERANKIIDQLFKIVSPEIKDKPYVYLNEEVKLVLNKGFMLMCFVYQRKPTVLINAMMRCISLADLYARMHLDRDVFNLPLAYYHRVLQGHGDLMDLKHINSLDFKNFILDLHEFDCRYFMIRDLEKRTQVYRNRVEENFNKVNQCYDGE